MYFHNVQTNLSKTEGTPHRPFFRLTFTFTKKKCLKIWAQHADKDMHNRIDRTELQERSKNYLQEAICKWIFVCSYSASFLSENVQLLKMKAVRPPAARQPRSPKAKPASETSAPGSTDTFSIYQIVSLLVRMATSRITFILFFCVMFFFSQ